jgi:hypothetical protein
MAALHFADASGGVVIVPIATHLAAESVGDYACAAAAKAGFVVPARKYPFVS